MLELWGGVECTIARIGDRFRDQAALTGHDLRDEDLDRIAELGVRTLRYPALWERVEAQGWDWTQARFDRMRRLGLNPIAGLLHHGGGPPGTSLLDPDLPAALARHAAEAAARLDWVEDWTPVNEPLTTARFSGLYGHWYPHLRDDRAFVAMLMNQIEAVRAAMAAVRAIIPAARLVQTEDVGFTHATPELDDQARYENHRRWLTFDLLNGRVGREHPLRAWLTGCGADPAALDRWAAEPLAPDVIGINHYLTSERFLDHRLERHPAESHGGNGRQAYADVSALRVREVEPRGVGGGLEEAWRRYGLPLAVTEAHNGSSREEQARWLAEVWRAAQAARTQGADVRAVTAWAMFGCVDWDSLLTLDRGHYEPGVFDIRGPRPRPTLLAQVARDLAAGRTPEHPVASTPGWWRRADRFPGASAPTVLGGRPLLVLGAGGTLGRAFLRICSQRGLAAQGALRGDCDITDPAAVAALLDRTRPWAVINAAGYVRVDEGERDVEAARRGNVLGPAVLAEAAAARGLPFLTFSSDLVFDGAKSESYVETDRVNPMNVYGLTKAEAEQAVLERCGRSLIVRTSAFFGPWDDYNFVTVARRVLRERGEFDAAGDQLVTPTYVPDLVHNSLDLLLDGATGLWHLANPTAVSWADLAREVARREGHDPDRIRERPGQALGWVARRPPRSCLDSERAALMPPLAEALDRYFDAVAVAA